MGNQYIQGGRSYKPSKLELCAKTFYDWLGYAFQSRDIGKMKYNKIKPESACIDDEQGYIMQYPYDEVASENADLSDGPWAVEKFIIDAHYRNFMIRYIVKRAVILTVMLIAIWIFAYLSVITNTLTYRILVNSLAVCAILFVIKHISFLFRGGLRQRYDAWKEANLRQSNSYDSVIVNRGRDEVKYWNCECIDHLGDSDVRQARKDKYRLTTLACIDEPRRKEVLTHCGWNVHDDRLIGMLFVEYQRNGNTYRVEIPMRNFKILFSEFIEMQYCVDLLNETLILPKQIAPGIRDYYGIDMYELAKNPDVFRRLSKSFIFDLEEIQAYCEAHPKAVHKL